MMKSFLLVSALALPIALTTAKDYAADARANRKTRVVHHRDLGMTKMMTPKPAPAPAPGKGMMMMKAMSPKGGKGMMSPKMMSPKMMMMMKMKGPAPAMAPFHLRILHMNDHHSHLFAEDFDFDVTEDMPASLANFTEIELSTGGMPMTVAAMEYFLEDGYASGMDDVYKLHAGDAITGTLFFTLYQGLADADMMKSICFDAMTPGNHEFDNGDTGFATFMDALESGESCPYTPILSANIAPGVDSPINGRLVSYLTYEYETGHKVGMIGITDQRTTLESSRPDPTTDVMDEVESTVAMIAELMADDVDIIILITHVGLGFDLSTMSAIPGVDVVVGGHSHTFMGDTPPVSAADPFYAYPETVVKEDNTTTCVVQAFQYSALMGLLDIEFDGYGDVVSCTGTPIVPFDISSATGDGDTLPDEAMADLTTHLESFGTWKAVTPDAIASAKLEVYDEEVAILRQSVIATAPEDICFERVPGNGRSDICERCASASQGGGVCNLVAKVFVDLTFTADIALQNAGGCRTDIQAGDFSIGDAFSLLPFQNTLVTAPVTGVQVKTLLEEGLANFIDLGGSTGSYPYAYGLRYDVDISAAAGSRITNLEVNPRVAGEWMPIDDAATYLLVTNSFVAGGGGRDGYDTFGEVPEITDTFIEYAQALVTFASAEGVLVDIPLEDYSTQSFLPVPEGCEIA